VPGVGDHLGVGLGHRQVRLVDHDQVRLDVLAKPPGCGLHHHDLHHRIAV
jgi:hypothetical protein